jgi:hypothetical protein
MVVVSSREEGEKEKEIGLGEAGLRALPTYKDVLLTCVPQSQKYHLENPYWKTFDPYVIPLLEKPMDLRRLVELDTSVPAKGAHYHEEALRDASVAEMYKGSD